MSKSSSYSKSRYGRSRYGRYRSPVVDRVNLFAFLRRSLRMFRNRWWIVLVTLALGSGIAIYLAMTKPDLYRATSRLGIAPKIAFSQRASDRATVQEEKANFVQDQIEYMRGAQVLGKVEEKMQDFRLPDNSVPGKSLNVGQGVGSTFVMTVDSPNLEYARRFARTWAQEFLAFKDELRNAVARKSMDKTRTDLSRQEERVFEARQRLEDYLQEHQIATSQDTGDAAQQSLVRLQSRRQSVMLDRQRLEMKSSEELADEQTGLANLPASALSKAATAARDAAGSAGDAAASESGPGPGERGDPLEKYIEGTSYRELKLRLNAVVADIQRHSDTLKPKHPYMVRLVEIETEIRRKIGDQLALIDEIRKARIDSLKMEESVLDRQVETQRAEVIRLRDIQREFQKRTEELMTERRMLEQLSRDLQALSQIQSNDEVITILDEGTASDRPIGPNRSRTIIVGVALGFFSGIGLIFLLHRLDDRIESAEDLERALDEPILGQLPFVSRRDTQEGTISIDHLDANNIFVEALRGVRSSIMFGELGGSKQVLMSTSSVPGDGKSTFTVNFAITLANAGNRVLLIDADLRRGTVASYFGLPSAPGLSEVLSGTEVWTDVLNATAHRTLLVIAAGKAVSNPGELLLSKGIKRLIEESRREFDYVIFDSPPVIGMDDAASLSSSCDGLIFVYRTGVTSLKLARLAVNTVRQRGGRILGLILNGVSIHNPDYYYTAYYYSHYTYGSRTALAELEESTGGAQPPHRPGGARLLEALRETEHTGAGSVPAHEALLGDEPGTLDVQASPVDPAGGRNDGGDGSRPPRPPLVS